MKHLILATLAAFSISAFATTTVAPVTPAQTASAPQKATPKAKPAKKAKKKAKAKTSVTKK